MRRPLLPTLLLAACTDLPRVDPSADDVPGSVLRGSVVVEGREAAPTLVLMSAADNPMPPVGTGTPVSFAGIAPDRFDPIGEGLLAAPFSLTDVPPGAWLLTAIHDLDENFHPGVSALATPSCGDRVGWNLPGSDGLPAPIEVGEDDLVDGVLVGPLRPITAPDPIAVPEGSTELVVNGDFTLVAVGMDVAFGALRRTVAGPEAAAGCRAGFRFVRVDADGDGDADSSPLLPLVEDRWPRAILQWLGEPVDTDDDGVPDDFDRKGVGDDVTIAAIGDPAPAGALPAPGVPVDVDRLVVRFTGFGQRIEPDGTSTILVGPDLPAGAWSLTLLTREGQIWQIPNEIDDRLAMSRNLPPPGLTGGADPRMGSWFTLTR